MSLKRFIMILTIILVGIVSYPIVMIYLLNNGNPYHNYLVDKYIPDHLEKKGYNDEDFLKKHKIAPKLGVNRQVYYVHYKVIFKDEPDMEYLYGLTKKGKKVIQFCEKDPLLDGVGHHGERTTEKTKHSEEECIPYLEKK